MTEAEVNNIINKSVGEILAADTEGINPDEMGDTQFFNLPEVSILFEQQERIYLEKRKKSQCQVLILR